MTMSFGANVLSMYALGSRRFLPYKVLSWAGVPRSGHRHTYNDVTARAAAPTPQRASNMVPQFCQHLLVWRRSHVG